MNHLFFTGEILKTKDGRTKFKLLLPSGKRCWTKDPVRTLNRIGHVFTFTPQHLERKGIINKFEMMELIAWRKKYGKIKACLLEIK